MKKKLMIIATFLFMFMFVGKVNAADNVLQIIQNENYAGDANKEFYIKFYLGSDYNADTVINLVFTQYNGVSNFKLNYKNSDLFEVVEDKKLIDEDASTGQKTYSTSIRFKKNLVKGTYELATMDVYHIEDNTKVCYVGVIGGLKGSDKTCADSNPSANLYYNDLGNPVTASEYGYYCKPHFCESYTYTDSSDKSTTVYFDKNGYEVDTKDEMINSCKCRQDEITKKYYDWDTTTDKEKEVDEAYYNYYCAPHYCTPYEYDGKTYYYDAKGMVVDTEEEMIASCKCRHDETTDKYYDLSNKEVTKEEYEKVCLCRTEDGKDGKIYYCKQGEICTKEEYDNKCPDNVQTGSNLPIALVGAGLAIAGIAAIATARHNKLRRI